MTMRPTIRLAFFALATAAAGAAVAQQRPPLAQPRPPLARPLPPGVPLTLPMLKANLIANAGTDTVRFQRDSYSLDPNAQTILARQAVWLLANPWIRASIEGHADVRQTREYALALGERRAAAVRNFLVMRGVPPQQLEIVSWGKERPAVAGVHDAAFLQNSRVVIELVAPEPAAPAMPQPMLPPPLPPRG
jgi:peptidoglycan-associated lipoprotein